MVEEVSSSKRQVSTLIYFGFAPLAKDSAKNMKQKLTETKGSVFGTPQMLPISHPVCRISVVGCGWCVAERGVRFCIFFGFMFVCMFMHMCLYTLHTV